MKIDDSVKFIRITTGEDLVSQITEISEGERQYYVLINPLKVLYVNDKSGYMTVSLMQWVFHRICENQEFTIYPEDVVTMGTPTEKMVEYYWSSVDHYNEVLHERKEAAKKEASVAYTDSELDNGTVEDSEGLELLKDLLENLGKGKGTLH